MSKGLDFNLQLIGEVDMDVTPRSAQPTQTCIEFMRRNNQCVAIEHLSFRSLRITGLTPYCATSLRYMATYLLIIQFVLYAAEWTWREGSDDTFSQ